MIEGIPVSEISKILGIKPYAVKMRLSRRGIRPIAYIGPTGLYKEEVVEQIREELPRGFASPKQKQQRAERKQIAESNRTDLTL